MDETTNEARIEVLRLALHGVCGYAADAINRELQARAQHWAGEPPPVFTREMMLECAFDAVRERFAADTTLSAEAHARLMAALRDSSKEASIDLQPPPP